MEKKVPEFKSMEEMARFFDENDTTKLELGPAEQVKYEPTRIVLSVRFDPEDMIALSRLARRFGMDRSTFVRFVVKRFLQAQDKEAGASTR